MRGYFGVDYGQSKRTGPCRLGSGGGQGPFSQGLFFAAATALVLTALWSLPASAQWAAQTVRLEPGWNAIYLEIQPQPADTALAVGDVPIASIWAWNKRFNTVQYIQDPDTLAPEQPEWLKYFPADGPTSFLTDLNILIGGRAYLVQYEGDVAMDWTLVGTPVQRRAEWMGDSFNLVGFHVKEGNQDLTLGEYFAASPAHAGQKMFKMNAQGDWVAIPSPGAEPIERGRAYWVYTAGASEYPGPLLIDVEGSTSLDYARSVSEHILTLENHRNAPVTVTLESGPSGPPPAGITPLLAGDVPLSYWRMDLDQNILRWEPLAGPTGFTIAPGESRDLRLAVRRTDFPTYVPPDPTTPFRYQGLLHISDGEGLAVSLPVISRGMQDGENGTVPAQGTGEAAPNDVAQSPEDELDDMFGHEHAGLWYGYASVDSVSEPRNNDPDVGAETPQPVPAEFVMPLIVHVDFEGHASLLQHVTVMWEDGTTAPDAENPGYVATETSGRYVLVTDDSLLGQFKGVQLRDGVPAGRRFTSAAFHHDAPLPMTGEFADVLSCTLELPSDHPLNPFKHDFHPDHALESGRAVVRSDGSQSVWYHITRDLSLAFTPTDEVEPESAQWGDTLIGGDYHESFVGLHQSTLHVSGTFRLHKVADVGVLNDGIDTAQTP